MSDENHLLVCREHSGLCVKQAEDSKRLDAAWRAIDAMRMWVIAGMGSLLLESIVIIINFLSKQRGG